MTIMASHHDNHVESVDELTRRIVILFECSTLPDPLRLEYAATDIEADEFLAAARRAGLAVYADRHVTPDLQPLPCRSLWH